MNSPRLQDLRRFYQLMEELEGRTGGKRALSACSGKMRWPRRGVYFFFEEGEQRSDTGGGLRVVRVGTHALSTGSGTKLWQRLSQHRGSAKSGGGNHRGSIFRLLVGEALARQPHAEQIGTWGQGNSASGDVRMGEFEHEQRVSAVIGAMPFHWLDVDDEPGPASLRGLVERNTIALLSNYNKAPLDRSSSEWLGQFSARPKVRLSGLWNQNHVDEPYDPSFLDVLNHLVSQVSPSA
jgi:hypothetical protein